MKPLVSTSWLEDNYQKVRIIDATWHMPSLQRDPHKEFLNEHIPRSVFFDLDKNSDQTTTIPHMLPKKEGEDHGGQARSTRRACHACLQCKHSVCSTNPSRSAATVAARASHPRAGSTRSCRIGADQRMQQVLSRSRMRRAV